MFLIKSTSPNNEPDCQSESCFKKIIKTVPITILRLAIIISSQILLPANQFFNSSSVQKPEVRGSLIILGIIMIEAAAFIYRKVKANNKDNKGQQNTPQIDKISTIIWHIIMSLNTAGFLIGIWRTSYNIAFYQFKLMFLVNIDNFYELFTILMFLNSPLCPYNRTIYKYLIDQNVLWKYYLIFGFIGSFLDLLCFHNTINVRIMQVTMSIFILFVISWFIKTFNLIKTLKYIYNSE